MVEGEQIYGDGVNIAARLESLAAPGGICLLGTVHEQIKNKLTLEYEDLGEQTVKNIAEPVRVWRVHPEPQGPAPPVSKTEASPVRQYWPRGGWALLGLLLILGVIVAVQHFSFRPPAPSAAIPPEQTSALPLPDKPSIAVPPFVNLSEDPKQDYFSDGLTEVLTGDLSKLSGLFVIARNSAFTYKGKAVKVQEVSKELGVQYVLEGSVLKADSQVRITAQLVDATTGHHLWAERYDRPLHDIFALQDEITQKIVTTLKLQLTLWEQGILVRKTTSNLEAYDSYLRGLEYFWRLTKEATVQARQMFERVIELDPQYAEAYTSLGWTYWREWAWQWSQDPQTPERWFALAQKALALDDSLPAPHHLLGQAYLWKKQHEQAIAEGERAITLDPNYAFGYFRLAETLNFAGKPAEAIGLAEKAMRRDPRNRDLYLIEVGFAYSFMRRDEEAITTLKTHLTRYPNNLGVHAVIAVSYSELGREEEARAEVAEVLRISPNLSLEVARQILPFKDQALLERFLAAWRKAGPQ